MFTLDDLKQFTERGWRIFPVAPNAKNPWTHNGYKAGTTDSQTIDRWLFEKPNANWGVATGEVSDLLVVDLDVKGDGEQTLRTWFDAHSMPWPKTYAVQTPSGGMHLYFHHVEGLRTAAKLMPGVDVRTTGGLVVLPGSTIDGRSYVALSDAERLEHAPQLLVDALRSRVQNESAWETPSDWTAGVAAGQRDEYLFKKACDLRRRLNDDRALVTRIILEAAANCDPPFPEVDALRKVQSAFEQDHSDALDLSRVPFQGDVSSLYLDVAKALRGELKPVVPDTGSARSDGLHLLYSGKVNGLVGDPESGKTLIGLAMIVDTLNRGGSAAILDLDHNGIIETLTRLISFGADPAILSEHDRFRLASPEARDEYLALVDDITVWAPSIVLVDSIGELGALFGANLNRDEEYAPLNRIAVQPFATAGSAVIAVDHMAKNEQSRAFGAGGTIRKKAAINGAYYEVSLSGGEGFTRSRGGRAYLKLKKDRPGGIKDQSPAERDPIVAEFVLAPPGLSIEHSTWVFESGVTLAARNLQRAQAKATTVRDQALEALGDSTLSTGDLKAIIHGFGETNVNRQVALIQAMVREGLLIERKQGTAKFYSRKTE